MTPEQFTYWLQGFAEIHTQAPTDEEWTIIKDHLATIFNKVTPDRKSEYNKLPNIVQPHNPVAPTIGREWYQVSPNIAPTTPMIC